MAYVQHALLATSSAFSGCKRMLLCSCSFQTRRKRYSRYGIDRSTFEIKKKKENPQKNSALHVWFVDTRA